MLLWQLISLWGKKNKHDLLKPMKQIPLAKLSVQKPLRCGNASEEETNCPPGGLQAPSHLSPYPVSALQHMWAAAEEATGGFKFARANSLLHRALQQVLPSQC